MSCMQNKCHNYDKLDWGINHVSLQIGVTSIPFLKCQIDDAQGPHKIRVIMIEDILEGEEDISRTLQLTLDKMFRIGYRDGIINGKQDSMQAGFDSGFAHASRLLVISGVTAEEAMRLVSNTGDMKEC